jgi:TonB dependent receptor.
MRIKNIILTYSLSDKLAKRLKFENLSINLSLNNFITITKYDGMDPEVPGATYPTTRSVSMGLNIGF